MTKEEFISRLRKRLSDLSVKDREERIVFYSEMIDDRIEDGASEEEAVSLIGDTDEIAAQITAERDTAKEEKRGKTTEKRSVWGILLCIIGSPVWISVLLAALAVVFSVYATVWSVVVSLWATVASLMGGAVGGAVFGVGCLIMGKPIPGMAVLGAAIFSAGAFILGVLGCKLLTKWVARITKMSIMGMIGFFKSGKGRN